MTDFEHRCSESECIYLGQRTSPNMCKCHKSTDQMMRSQISSLVKALTDIIEANKDFRDGMPQSWDGDPLQDACDAAAKLLPVLVGGTGNG